MDRLQDKNETCAHCAKRERKSSQISMITATDKRFGHLCPPKKQPRSKKFRPKCERYGLGTKSVRPVEDGEENMNITNLDLLQVHGVLQRVSDSEGIKAGDVIMAASPFVFCLSTSNRGIKCDNCLQKLPEKKLSCSCNCTMYCSTNCREQDLENHGEECFYIKKRRAPPASDTARFLLRLLLKLRKRGEMQADIVPNQMEPRRFQDLLDHFDDILGSSRVDMVNSYYTEIIRIFGIEEAPDPDYFLQCYGRMAINSFNVLDVNQESVGMALYLGPSVMDHSCQPNASVSFDGKNIVVRSLIDRQALDFSEVFISYVGLLDHTEHRREHLLKHYYFSCQCSRCSDPNFERAMFGVGCSGCGSGEIIMTQTFKPNEISVDLPCGNCGAVLDVHSLERYWDTCELVSEKLNQSQLPLDASQFCLKLMRHSRFSPNHILFLKTTEAAFQNYLLEIEQFQRPEHHGKTPDEDLLEDALFHGLNLVNGLKRFSQHPWSHEAVSLLQVAELEFVLGNNCDCEKHLNKAKTILRISMGESGAATHLRRISEILKMLSAS